MHDTECPYWYQVLSNNTVVMMMMAQQVWSLKKQQVNEQGEGLCHSFATPNPFVLTNKLCLNQVPVFR